MKRPLMTTSSKLMARNPPKRNELNLGDGWLVSTEWSVPIVKMKSQMRLEIRNSAKVRLTEIIEFLSENRIALTTMKRARSPATTARTPVVVGKFPAFTASVTSAVLVMM